MDAGPGQMGRMGEGPGHGQRRCMREWGLTKPGLGLQRKTELVGDHASELLSPLQQWGHIPDFDVGMPQFSLPQLDVPELDLPELRINIDEVKERIASVINVDFRAALDTTNQLKNSLDAYIEGAAS